MRYVSPFLVVRFDELISGSLDPYFIVKMCRKECS